MREGLNVVVLFFHLMEIEKKTIYLQYTRSPTLASTMATGCYAKSSHFV